MERCILLVLVQVMTWLLEHLVNLSPCLQIRTIPIRVYHTSGGAGQQTLINQQYYLRHCPALISSILAIHRGIIGKSPSSDTVLMTLPSCCPVRLDTQSSNNDLQLQSRV
jgi:hypothetical protein